MARRLRQSFFAAVLVAAVPISASAQNGAAEGSGMTRPVVFPSVSGRIAYQANGGTRFASGGSGG